MTTVNAQAETVCREEGDGLPMSKAGGKGNIKVESEGDFFLFRCEHYVNKKR